MNRASDSAATVKRSPATMAATTDWATAFCAFS